MTNNNQEIDLVDIENSSMDSGKIVQLISENFSSIREYLKSLSIHALESQTIDDVILDPNTPKRVSHRLRTIPKYRIVVRQSGGGAITDGNFTKNYIELTNTGTTQATISILILKE